MNGIGAVDRGRARVMVHCGERDQAGHARAGRWRRGAALGIGAAVEAADRDLEARDAFLAGHRRRASPVADRADEGLQLGAQRLGMADREMPHRIAAVGLEAEALGDLAGQQVADDVFLAGRDVTVRALNGVSQLVLMCASTPEAVRNCSSAMSSRSATALESCGCTSTISESVNQRIRSMSCTARSMTTPTFDMRGGNGPTRVIAIERMSSSRIASLIAWTAGIEALDMADHQGDAGAARRRDDVAAFLHRGGDRLLDQHVHAAARCR